MIVTLEIKDNRPKALIKKLKAVLKPCEINAKIKKQNRISVLQLTYKLFRGSPDMKKLSPFLRGCGETIVCNNCSNAELSPYKRFSSSEFAQAMMLSFIRELLSRTDCSLQKLRLAYCDPIGEYPDTAEALLEYCQELTVVTNMPRFYETVSERILRESGGTLIVSNTVDALRDCDIVICSEAPDIHFPLSPDAIVFSAKKPLVSLSNTVIYDYRTAVPYKYQRLRPDYIDEFSFLSALYSIEGVSSLARLVPSAAADGEDIYTAERLASRLSTISRSA